MQEKDIRIVNEVIEQINNTSKEDLDKAIKMADEEYLQEDIKILEDYAYAMCTISSTTEQDQRIAQAIENLIARNKELEEKINKLVIIKTKLLKEFECAKEGFMKKQIPTSVVDGTIVQEVGWILQEINDVLQEK